MNSDELNLRINKWQEDRFGVVNIPATYRKLLEEVGELGEAIINYNEKYIDEEIGDIGFILSIMINAVTDNKTNLFDVIKSALIKNEKRIKRI